MEATVESDILLQRGVSCCVWVANLAPANRLILFKKGCRRLLS